MLYCSSLTCPYLLRHGHPSEYAQGVDACRDCGAAVGPTAPERPDAHDVGTLASTEPISAGLWIRLGMTLLIPTGLVLFSLLELPGFDDATFVGSSGLGWLAAGLTPWLLGYACVELGAVLVPALRARRIEGKSRRRPLEFAALLAGMALVILFVLFLVAVLKDTWFQPGLPITAWVLALSGGAFIALFVARAASKVSLANGFALSIVAILVWGIVEMVQGVQDAAELGYGSVFPKILILAGPAVVTVVLAKPELIRLGILTHLPRRLPWPISGIGPQEVVLGVLLTGVSILSGWLGVIDYDNPLIQWLYTEARPEKITYYVVVALSAIVFGWCFVRPARVREAWRRLGVSEVERSKVTRKVIIGLILAVLTVVGIAATQYLGLSVAQAVLIPVSVVVVTAFALDLQAEWVMRRAYGGLAPAWELHRMYAVVPAVELLEAEGIAVLARSRYFRALFPFFAPYVPVALMVPVARLEAASAMLEERLGDSRVIPKAVAGAFD
ncbi:MAG: hypothetical protein ACI9MR_000945 [Myxococcota bacterium]|jgi:hypothetical protein